MRVYKRDDVYYKPQDEPQISINKKGVITLYSALMRQVFDDDQTVLFAEEDGEWFIGKGEGGLEIQGSVEKRGESCSVNSKVMTQMIAKSYSIDLDEGYKQLLVDTENPSVNEDGIFYRIINPNGSY